MELVIGNKNYSSWSLRPWLLLTHHGIAFEERRIPLDTAAMPALMAQYTEANKVPVLNDGGLRIWDSLAICEYVSETFLAGRGWPEERSARARARSCAAEMHSGFFALREMLPMNCRATGRHVASSPSLDRDLARIDHIWSTWRQCYRDQGDWLFGEFSIADCMFAPVAFRVRTYGILLSEHSQCYLETLLQHPRMQQWLAQAHSEAERIDAAEVGL